MVRDPRQVDVHPVCHPRGCRCYVVVDPDSREACVIDPLLDRLGEITKALAERGGKLRWVVDTHSHADHLSGAAALRARTEAEVVMHPAASSEVATVRPSDGEVLAFGEHGLRIHHAPGNSGDGLVVEVPGALFTGDTLWIGTVGIRDAPGADPRAWFDTLHRLLDDRPETTILHPGHDVLGRTMTTLRQERAGNTWLRMEDPEAFAARLGADDRSGRKDAEDLLEANRKGLSRPPRRVEAAGPARRAAGATGLPAPSPGALALAGPWRALLLLAGAVICGATILGWWFHEALHAAAGLTGAVLLGVGLQGGTPARRRREARSELFYEGPARRSIAD